MYAQAARKPDPPVPRPVAQAKGIGPAPALAAAARSLDARPGPASGMGARVAQLTLVGGQLNARPAAIAQRALAGDSANADSEQAMPAGPDAVERGVRSASIQRALATVQLGGGESKADIGADLEREYARLVKKAVALLSGKIGFGASPEGKYDKRFWKQINDDKHVLAIEATVDTATAIKALFKAPPKTWCFDCAEFVQVCNLYATMEIDGEEEVNKTKPLILRQHGSTFLDGTGVTFDRDAKDKEFDAIFPLANNNFARLGTSVETLVAHAPAGSRFCFKNPVGKDTPYRNENAVAIGGGKFAAHPLGNDLTADQIVAKLVEFNLGEGLGGEDGGREQIFLSQVQIYGTIPMGGATMKALGLQNAAKLMWKTD